jgi:hypothetical protein
LRRPSQVGFFRNPADRFLPDIFIALIYRRFLFNFLCTVARNPVGSGNRPAHFPLTVFFGTVTEMQYAAAVFLVVAPLSGVISSIRVVHSAFSLKHSVHKGALITLLRFEVVNTLTVGLIIFQAPM